MAEITSAHNVELYCHANIKKVHYKRNRLAITYRKCVKYVTFIHFKNSKKLLYPLLEKRFKKGYKTAQDLQTLSYALEHTKLWNLAFLVSFGKRPSRSEDENITNVLHI